MCFIVLYNTRYRARTHAKYVNAAACRVVARNVRNNRRFIRDNIINIIVCGGNNGGTVRGRARGNYYVKKLHVDIGTRATL